MQGSAQPANELGFEPKENGEPLKSFKKKNVVFDLGFKRQNRHCIRRKTEVRKLGQRRPSYPADLLSAHLESS